jgi:hypothetical protein
MTKELIKEREKEIHGMAEAIGSSPAGVIEKLPDLRRRQTSIYYRPIKDGNGNVEWTPTAQLASDSAGRETYLARGFRLSPPKTDTTPPEAVIDTEKESLLSQVKDLENKLKMANARAARGKEPT